MSDSQPSGKQPGLVCTFYSYKGGVGRSMALANVGVLMATEGHRVLLVDWDLEAPGLEVYFEKAARLVGDRSEIPGVIDLLHGQAVNEPVSWRKGLLKAEFFGNSLDILSSGRKNSDYRRRVQSLDWETLFSEHHIGNYIDELRAEWRTEYDFVLIDSRTGVTDIGDVCTVILPDVLVLLFVTNHQSVEGTKDAMARAVSARSKMPVNRNKLLGVPVPARDERDREYDKSLEWQSIFATEFSDMYREWLPKDVKPSDALNRIFLPYVASWSFGEHIPVVESERERTDPTSLGAAYARLATLLSHRLDWSAIEAGASASEVVGTRVELSKAREVAREAEVLRVEEEKRRQEEVAIAQAKELELSRLLEESATKVRRLRTRMLWSGLLLVLVFLSLWLWILLSEARMARARAEHAEASAVEAKESEYVARASKQQAEEAEMKAHRAVQNLQAVTSLVGFGFRWDSREKRVEAATDQAKEITSLAPILEYLHILGPKSLSLNGCQALKTVEDLSGLTKLESIDLSGCATLPSASGLIGLTALHTLNLSSCKALQDVKQLSGLISLRDLDLSNCGQLREVEALAKLTALQRLNLNGCTLLDTQGLQRLAAALPKTEITLPDGKTTKP